MKELHPGESFNPHGLFVGGFIPNCIMRYPGLSPMAKLTWARLQQFAGANGDCFPSYTTIGEELGISRRHAERAVKELVDKGFIRRISPSPRERGAKKTTRYEFLWHSCFATATLRNTRDESVHSGNSDLGTDLSPTSDESVPSTRDGSVACLGTDPSHKDNHLKQQREDNDYNNPEDLPGEVPQSYESGRGRRDSLSEKSEKQPSTQTLSPEQEKYIALKVAYQEANEGFRKGKGAFRASLLRLAKQGELDMSDIDDLKEWKEREEADARRRDEERIEEEKRERERQAKEELRKGRLDEAKCTLRAHIEENSLAPEDIVEFFEELLNDTVTFTDLAGGNFDNSTVDNACQQLYPDEYRQARKRWMEKLKSQFPQLYGGPTPAPSSRRRENFQRNITDEIVRLIRNLDQRGDSEQVLALKAAYPVEFERAMCHEGPSTSALN